MQVKYIPLFKQSLNKMLSCSDGFYTKQQLKDVVTNIKQCRNLLLANPGLGSKEDMLASVSGNYRSILICRRIKLIYYLTEDEIYFTDLWDTRQSPDSLVKRVEDL